MQDTLVAVSEGIQNDAGNYVADSFQKEGADAFGHKILAGAARFLEQIVRQEIGCKVRSVELNLMQRCASHIASGADIYEARLLGAAAANHAIDGNTGEMACVKRISDTPYKLEFDFVPIQKIANRVKTVPLQWINQAGNDVTEDMVQYIRPLIQGEMPITFRNGVPVHLKLF